MKTGHFLFRLGIVFVLLGFPVGLNAETVASTPSGFFRMTLLGNSDTFVSVPFLRSEAAQGMVQSVSGNQISWQNSPGWASGQFVYQAGVQTNTYFVIFRTGVKEGHYFGVTANDASSIWITLGSDDLSGVVTGDRVSIIPYWTLGSIFPSGRSIHVSPSPGSRSTEVIVPDMSFVGVNPSAGITYYFWSSKWRRTDKPFSQGFDDDPILPDAYLIVRHYLGTSTVLTLSGGLVMTKWAVPLNAHPNTQQDNLVGLLRPVPVSLDNSGLIASGAFSASPSPGSRTDELYTFDNTAVGMNKSASHTFYYWNGAWRQTDKPFSYNAGTNEVFSPGTGVIIRKNTSTTSAVWVNSPGY
jgi:uncharacterized protein (TIGR02597 family)